jgi:hypothetical protein
MESPYTRYLEEEFDEIAILKEMQIYLSKGNAEEALRLAMKYDAVKYIKQSLKKVDYEILAGRTKKNSTKA